MRWTTRLRLFLRSLFLGRRFERDLDDEVRFHLQTVTDRYIAGGMTPADARDAALRDFGGVERNKDACRDTRRVAWLEHLGRDSRYALRMLRRNPGFAVLGVLIMALGIGANTAVFSVVYAVLLKPLAFYEPERIVTLTNARTHGPSTQQESNSLGNQISAPDFWDWHDQATTFEAMAYYDTRRTSVLTGPAADYAIVTKVTPEFFRVFTLSPARGRLFTAGEENRGGSLAAIVSVAYAQAHFGDPARATGQTIRVFDRAMPVVGVMPAGFDFPDRTDIWCPSLPLGGPGVTRRMANNYRAIGRLKTGVALTQAQADMATVAARLEQQYPASNAGRSVALTPLQDVMVGSVRSMLYMLLGAVGLVLLIACANMATLLLAKATARTPEIAVRAALGASRGRIVQQLLVEGLVLAGIAGLAGLAVAFWGTKALVAVAPGNVPRLAETGIDINVFAFTLATCVIVSVLFALPPALHASRIDVGDPLKGGATRSVLGGRAGRLREGLVVAEIALTLVLLAGGGLLIRSLIALQHVSLGYRPEHVLVMEATMPAAGQDGRRANAFFSGLLAEVATLPGVEAAGATMAPPGYVDADSGYYIDYLPETLDVRDSRIRPAVMSVIAPGTFAALGVPITRGRDFRDSDTRQTAGVAIINEAIAREAFPGQDPIGRTIYCLFDTKNPATIIGVVGDVRQYGPARTPASECYLSYGQHFYNNATLNLVVRTSLDPSALHESMRRKAHEQAAEASVRFTTLEAVLDTHFATPRFRALLLGLFGAIALCLALAGVYGVMSFIVSQRASEMGLRMALGASPGDVLRLVLGRGLRLAAAGLALGLACAAGATRLLAGQLFGVTPNDAMTYAIAIALLGVMSLIAVYIPARRSTRIDPLAALRQE
jgi:putative ABC transport system permease protein